MHNWSNFGTTADGGENKKSYALFSLQNLFSLYMFYFMDLQLTAEDQLANRASLSSIRSSRGLNLPGRTSSRMRQSRQNFTLEKTAEKSIPEERVI